MPLNRGEKDGATNHRSITIFIKAFVCIGLWTDCRCVLCLLNLCDECLGSTTRRPRDCRDAGHQYHSHQSLVYDGVYGYGCHLPAAGNLLSVAVASTSLDLLTQW